MTIHNSIDSDDEFHLGCQNVSQCHHKQSFGGLNTHLDD